MKRQFWQLVLSVAGVFTVSLDAQAYDLPLGAKRTPQTLTEQGLLKTTAGCKPATAAIELDVNNVRSRLMTGGDMWYNTGSGNAAYEVPKGSGHNSLYAGSCWIGGIDANGQLKVSAQLFRQRGNDYWPGPIDKATGDITAASCSEWDRFWKVNEVTVKEFIELYRTQGPGGITEQRFDVIKQWPATGNIYAVGANNNPLPELLAPADAYGYAPFIDVNGDGIYNWQDGDYPRGYGISKANPTQFIWWVFNDRGNTKTMTKTQSIGMEVQTSAFAYTSTDFLNDATFFNYRLINRGSLVLDSCFIATFTDADLGYPFDDYIGCDTARGLGILYNASTPDGAFGQNSYGTRIPMVGVDFFIGPRKYYTDPVTGEQTSKLLGMSTFSYFDNGNAINGDPRNGAQFYYLMTGATNTGVPFSNDQSKGSGSVGYGTGPVIKFVFPGDPAVAGQWSMCDAKVAPGDRRFIHSSGPFKLLSGEKNDITIGVVWVDDVGSCPNTSFKKIRAADDIAQRMFDLGFARPVGPDAPKLTIRELDKKLIFYIDNPPSSNNYGERYGNPKFFNEAKYKELSAEALAAGSADSFYRFEGYRVYQLRKQNSSITNPDDAIQVFQCDVRNGVSQVVNYVKNADVRSPIDRYDPVIQVDGQDSGIVHSFVLTQDRFATGTNQTFSNYKTYYFKIVAYGYNNFAEFDANNAITTQRVQYLESVATAGESNILTYAAMPNPMNQNGDTMSNSVYGDGVIIRRIEGIGNGGLDVQIDDTTEASILQNNRVYYPTYKRGKGPVDIKVVDPVKVVEADWRITFYDSFALNPTDPTYLGLMDTAKWKLERMDANGAVAETIYSERDISGYNEQLLAAYGLAVNIKQVTPPGADQSRSSKTPNGYITSDVTFANTALPWLTGVHDGSGRSLTNWIRSGQFKDDIPDGTERPACYPFDDYKADSFSTYSAMFSNNTNVRATWAPLDLAASADGTACGFAPAAVFSVSTLNSLYLPPTSLSPKMSEVPNVDLVFTSDKSKWTRCVVLEAQFSPELTESGMTRKFRPRSHRSWNMGISSVGTPEYATDKNDTSFSWFPGYAINQLTGERLNICFAEDSYLKNYNGADMIWNPTGDVYNVFGETVFGGRHFTYILNTRYDSCRTFARDLAGAGSDLGFAATFRQIRWVGIPLSNYGTPMLSLKDGLIPTETRLRFRVSTPYKQFPLMPNQAPLNNQNPMYSFSTKGMAPTDHIAGNTTDSLMDRIFAVPNPYKGEASGGNTYETNRLETKIKIINLPKQATVHIYSLDGTLIRTLQKDNNDPAITWDLYNQAGLPIAGGMYLIHVNAYGKDKVIKWFGTMRPLDVTNN